MAGREVEVMALEISGVNPDWSRGGAVRLAISMSHTVQVFNPPSAVLETERRKNDKQRKSGKSDQLYVARGPINHVLERKSSVREEEWGGWMKKRRRMPVGDDEMSVVILRW